MYIYICVYLYVYTYSVFIFICTYIFACVCIGMVWLRLVGSLQKQVSSAKEPYKRDYILQKRPIF